MSSYLDIKKQLDEIDNLNKSTNALPERRRIVNLVKMTQAILFSNYYHYLDRELDSIWASLLREMNEEIKICLAFNNEDRDSNTLTEQFLQSLVEIKRILLTDIQSIYDGDPAAKTKEEILLCYPGFYAISIYRIAHVLYTLNVPYIPRIMSEYAHEKTGIDINPGATIGEYFCIDHGTGIVIGETAIIGHHVKLYQGVTIGAKSFELDENGNPKKSGKRHPNIGNHVVIYANATILGGDTYIGDNSIIGGNTWLLHSVDKNSKIYYTNN